MSADVPRGSAKLLWYELGEADSIAAIFPEQRRGIYVLEFANGERYVGQAEDAVKRFTQHRHGSKHHEPWTDITAFGFLEVPAGPLTPHEIAMLNQQKSQGYALRNKTWNYEHEQPSPLDEVLPVEVQKHWVTGYFPPVDRVALAEAATFIRTRKHSLLPLRERQGQVRFYGDKVVFYECVKGNYSITVDVIYYPLGSNALDRLTDSQIRGIRRLAVRSMRNASARLNVRSRSEELTKRVFAKMLELAK